MLKFSIGHGRGQQAARGLGFLLFNLIVTVSATRQQTRMNSSVAARAPRSPERSSSFQAAPRFMRPFSKMYARRGQVLRLASHIVAPNSATFGSCCGAANRDAGKRSEMVRAFSPRRDRAPCRCA
jgi:hypothetical protein